MAGGQLCHVLCHIRSLAGAASVSAVSDRALLARFAAERDQAAFAELVRRHGPLVWGVCRRLLRHEEDAEDAFQATFLILARKAGSHGWQASIAGWLYETARRTAQKARVAAARRHAREHEAQTMRSILADAEANADERREALSVELARLPSRYREPLMLCALEGLTTEEAARRLGCPAGTIKSRLARGRDRLRAMLFRRGVTLSAAGLAGLLAQEATAAVPARLTIATVQAALRSAGESISANVATLTEEGIKAMSTTKTKAGLALMILAATVSLVGWVESSRPTEPTSTPRKQVNGPVGLENSTHPTKDTKSAKTDRYGDPLPEGALLRLGTVRQRHARNTTSAVFTPDSKTVIASDMGDHVIFWDVATGKETRRLRAPASRRGTGGFALALTADGKLLAGGSWGKVFLWNPNTGAAIAEWDVAQDQVAGIAFDRDGKTAALRYQGKTIDLWDVAGGKKLHTLEGHDGNVWCMAFAPDGKLLASGSYEDSNVRLWDVATGKQVRAIPAMDGYRLAGGAQRSGDVLGVAFSPDGKTLAASGNGSRIRFWNPETGERLRESAAPQFAAGLMELHYLAGGKSLASIGGLKVRTWDAETGKMLRQSEGLHAGQHLSVSPDGKVLATAGGGPNTIDLWDAATLKPLHNFIGHRERVTAVTFAADGRTMFSASDINPANPIYEWDLATCKPLREFGKPPNGGASSLLLSPDRRFLFACGFDIHQYELANGKEVRTFKGHTSNVESVSLSADGKRLASICRTDHTLRIWDVATGNERLKIEANQDWPCAAVLSHDGKTVISGGFNDGTVRMWDTGTGKVIRNIATPHQPVYTVALSPNGKLLAAAGMSPSVTLYDAATGKLLREMDVLPKLHWIARLGFSPDGRTLAVAGDDNVVSLWETATGGRRAEFKGHAGAAYALAFSPDGRRLASGSDDTTILVWDVAGQPSGEALAELWSDLGGNDAAKAHRAVWTLAARSKQAMPFLQQHVKPAPAPSADAREQFTRLLADLDSDDFATRQKADQQLEKLGPFAEPLARKALQNGPSIEVRRRLEKLLARLEQADAASWLRSLRALEVLEHVATPEARELLHKLAAGAAEARLTREAKAALQRLAR